jgi:hypothetical protein
MNTEHPLWASTFLAALPACIAQAPAGARGQHSVDADTVERAARIADDAVKAVTRREAEEAR